MTLTPFPPLTWDLAYLRRCNKCIS